MRRFSGFFRPAAVVGILLGPVFLAPSSEARHSPCIALHEAVFMDEPDVVGELLAHGVDVNCLNEVGHTPLITAVEGASAESIQLLLAHGADPRALNGYGETPLQQARYALSRFGETLSDGQPTQLTQLIKSMVDQLEKAK